MLLLLILAIAVAFVGFDGYARMEADIGEPGAMIVSCIAVVVDMGALMLLSVPS